MSTERERIEAAAKAMAEADERGETSTYRRLAAVALAAADAVSVPVVNEEPTTCGCGHDWTEHGHHGCHHEWPAEPGHETFCACKSRPVGAPVATNPETAAEHADRTGHWVTLGFMSGWRCMDCNTVDGMKPLPPARAVATNEPPEQP